MKNQKYDYQNDFCFKLRKVTRAVTKSYDRALKPLGIRSTQLHLLLSLESSEWKMMTSFAESLGMDRTTLTRNIRRLESSGFVLEDRLSKKSDKRTRRFKLTDKGRKVVLSGTSELSRINRFIIDYMGNEDTVKLFNNLSYFREETGRLLEAHNYFGED